MDKYNGEPVLVAEVGADVILGDLFIHLSPSLPVVATDFEQFADDAFAGAALDVKQQIYRVGDPALNRVKW